MGANEKHVAGLKTFFGDVIGSDAVWQSGETGRPYIKVAQKAGAKLYMAVDLGATCHHPAVKEGEEQKHVRAVSVTVRFVQVGGEENIFAPKLPVRVPIGEGEWRLSKFDFALCPIYATNPVESWKSQNVTEKLVDWANGLLNAPGVEHVTTPILTKVVEYNLIAFAASMDKVSGLFDVNAPQVDAAGHGAEFAAAVEKAGGGLLN